MLGYPFVLVGLLWLVVSASFRGRGSLRVTRKRVSASGAYPFLLIVLGATLEIFELLRSSLGFIF